MNSSGPISIKTPQQSILKWFLKDVKKQPMIKVSPTFEIDIGGSKENVKLTLSNNNNLIQMKVQPLGSLTARQLAALISDASLIFRFGDNQTKQFDKIRVRPAGDSILLDVTRFQFSVVSNEHQDPFEVEVQLNLKPIAPKDERVVPPQKTESELVKMVWEMADIAWLPLIKESPVFSFNIGKISHQLRLSMDINNDRIQMRMTPLKTHINTFAQSIEKVSFAFQPGHNKPPIKIENVQVGKKQMDLIYLETAKLSFAQLTDSYKTPLEVTVQVSFRKSTIDNMSTIQQPTACNSDLKPLVFDWQISDYEMHPLEKTSPGFNIELADGSLLSVQFQINHHRDLPIALFMKTSSKMEEIASSFDTATIVLTDANGVQKEFGNVVPQVTGELIAFEMVDNNLKFVDLTNQFRSSFRIQITIHRSQSIHPMPSQGHEATVPNDQLESSHPTDENSVSIFAPNPMPSTLLRQLNEMLVDQSDCDVHFDCQGTRIGAHRPILQTRSAFFKELLSQHTDQSVFPFKNVDAETMADTLQYIYTGTAPRIAITAERLLSVANLMELPALHGLAQQQLLNKDQPPSDAPSPESIAKLLDLFGNRMLQAEVGAFIRMHLDELLTNSHFERELKGRPSVCFDLLVWIHESNKANVSFEG